MERSTHFEWENPLFLWVMFNSYVTNYQRVCFFGDYIWVFMNSLSLYKRCLWNFIRLIFLWILRGVPSNINMGNHKQNPDKIHQNPSCTTHYRAAGSYEHQHQKRCSKQAKEPQWMKLGIMGAGSRWNPSSTSKEGAVAGKLLGLPTLASSSFLATCVSLNGRIQSMANLGFPAFGQKLGIYFTQLMA